MLRRTPSLTIGWIEQPSSAFLRFLASSFRTLSKLRQTMRRIAIPLAGLVCAAAAFAAPAAAYEIDPLTRQPIEYADQTYRPQATVIPREVVPFSSRYGAGTIVISTAERRLYYTLGGGQAIRYAGGVGRPGLGGERRPIGWRGGRTRLSLVGLPNPRDKAWWAGWPAPREEAAPPARSAALH